MQQWAQRSFLFRRIENCCVPYSKLGNTWNRYQLNATKVFQNLITIYSYGSFKRTFLMQTTFMIYISITYYNHENIPANSFLPTFCFVLSFHRSTHPSLALSLSSISMLNRNALKSFNIYTQIEIEIESNMIHWSHQFMSKWHAQRCCLFTRIQIHALTLARVHIHTHKLTLIPTHTAIYEGI